MDKKVDFAIDQRKQYSGFKIVFVGGNQDGKSREVNRLPPVVNMEGGEVYARMTLQTALPNAKAEIAAVIYVLQGMTDADVINAILGKFSNN